MGYIYLKHSFYTFFLEGSAKLIFAQSMQWLLVTYSDAMGLETHVRKVDLEVVVVYFHMVKILFLNVYQ